MTYLVITSSKFGTCSSGLGHQSRTRAQWTDKTLDRFPFYGNSERLCGPHLFECSMLYGACFMNCANIMVAGSGAVATYPRGATQVHRRVQFQPPPVPWQESSARHGRKLTQVNVVGRDLDEDNVSTTGPPPTARARVVDLVELGLGAFPLGDRFAVASARMWNARGTEVPHLGFVSERPVGLIVRIGPGDI